MKGLYDEVISAIVDFIDEWDLSTTTSMEDVCGSQAYYIENSTSVGDIT